MKLKSLLFCLIILSMALSVDAASTKQKAGRTFDLLHGDISVSAILVNAMEREAIPPFYEFLLIIENARRRYEVKSDIIVVDDLNDAVDVLKKNIYTKDGYTFIRHECGGGNGWRCNVDSIFTIKNGVLQRVGDMAGGEERGAVGQNYAGGLFMDSYDKFESNGLTSHASAPFLEIYSRDNKGTLKVDLDVTWQRNLDDYQKNKAVVDRILKKSAMSEDESEELLSALLQNVVAAKYCDHIKELEEALQIADRSFSKDIAKKIHEIVKNVISGELPNTRVKRTR